MEKRNLKEAENKKGRENRDVCAISGAFDYLETTLNKFDDGPFFLGQLSHVDIAYAPHFEMFQIFLEEVFKYNIFSGRPKLATWFEGAAVAYVADLFKVPAIFMKAVTDIVDGDKPISEEYLQNVFAVTAALGQAVTQVIHYINGKCISEL